MAQGQQQHQSKLALAASRLLSLVLVLLVWWLKVLRSLSVDRLLGSHSQLAPHRHLC
jgi:hypothetical protein